MRVVALISGGKDSCYNMMQCVAEGHEIIALANLKPQSKDELDSYMYQTVGHHAIDLYAEAVSLPLYRRVIKGQSVEQGRDYLPNNEDEVEDLYELLREIKEMHDVEAVSVGAILSDYQRVRVESVCLRLGLTPLAYLWRRDQTELLNEMIQCGVEAILIKVAALGLDPNKHLGKTLKEIQPHMMIMKEKYGLNVCGEGGEYETFTLDCPLFNKKIVVDDREIVNHSDDAFAPVAYINFRKMHLEDKPVDPSTSHFERLKHLPLKRSCDIFKELISEEEQDSNTYSSCETHRNMSVFKNTGCVKASKPLTCHTDSVHVWVTGVYAVLAEEGQTVETVTQNAMERLKEILSEHGMEMKHLVVVHLYVQNMADFARVNSVYKTYFSINPPARVCVQATLASKMVLQLDCHGYHHPDNQIPRNTMHVQGLSHWAPANIGPYSQAVKLGDKLFIAGQIPLIPATMKIIEGGIVPQCRLSLRHVERVLSAMTPGVTLAAVSFCVCYVTDAKFIPIAKKEWGHVVDKTRGAGDCDAESSPLEGVVEYVVIPALPRGALVEWQAEVLISDVNWKCNCGSEEVGNGMRISWECQSSEEEVVTDSEEKIWKYFRGTIDCESENTTDHLKDAMQAVVSALACQVSKQKIKPVFSVYVFYKAERIALGQLTEVLPSMLKEAFNDQAGPVPAFVPVDRLTKESTVMRICCT